MSVVLSAETVAEVVKVATPGSIVVSLCRSHEALRAKLKALDKAGKDVTIWTTQLQENPDSPFNKRQHDAAWERFLNLLVATEGES